METKLVGMERRHGLEDVKSDGVNRALPAPQSSCVMDQTVSAQETSPEHLLFYVQSASKS